MSISSREKGHVIGCRRELMDKGGGRGGGGVSLVSEGPEGLLGRVDVQFWVSRRFCDPEMWISLFNSPTHLECVDRWRDS